MRRHVGSSVTGACAVETYHTYSLIYDDLPAMDNDDLRRGRPTCHKAYGEAMAILAGDALLTLAFEILARDTRPSYAAAKTCVALAEAAGATALVGGQADDLSLDTPPAILPRWKIFTAVKPGRCVLACLCRRLTGADEAQQLALERFGKKIGLAFQIADDLLDVAGR